MSYKDAITVILPKKFALSKNGLTDERPTNNYSFIDQTMEFMRPQQFMRSQCIGFQMEKTNISSRHPYQNSILKVFSKSFLA